MQNMIHKVKQILDINQTLVGNDYLKAFVKNIATVLDIKYVFVGHPLNDDLVSVKTAAVWANGEFVENFVYQLKDTPCEVVLTGQRVCIHEKNVCSNFPNDLLLQEMGVESYIGAPVLSSVEKSGVSSILVLLDSNPIEDKEFFTSIVDFLAVRASAELQRQAIESRLKEEVTKQTKEIQEINSELFAMLQEKEMILKELYHRVKNNFQMVISLIWLESNKINNVEKRSAFLNLINRIKSMAVIHDYLYSQKNVSFVHSADYLNRLITEIEKINDNQSLQITCEINDFNLDLNNAVDVGMIINEVLTNSIKHHDQKEICKIDIFFKKYEKYLLTIQDNGKGFDDTNDSRGLGLGLIKQLAGKLKQSEFIFIKNHGTRFELSFED